LIGTETGFFLYDDPNGNNLEKVGEDYKIDFDKDGRLNDGRCDRQGRFICGGYNGKEEDGTWPKQ
jgi:sugar lactone lactonase YvrE